MTNDKYIDIGSEGKLVDTLEHIDDLEGIFFEMGDRKDAKQLISIYDDFIENYGMENTASFEMLRKRNDLVKYLSKINGEQLSFFSEMYKKWKI